MERDENSTPSIDETLNPHRAEEQARAREHTLEILQRRGVKLHGDETEEQLGDLWNAVDRFDALVQARGGDSYTNAPESSAPENPLLVLPERSSREGAGNYIGRIIEAAHRITIFEG